jgi:hypothetical protein
MIIKKMQIHKIRKEILKINNLQILLKIISFINYFIITININIFNLC